MKVDVEAPTRAPATRGWVGSDSRGGRGGRLVLVAVALTVVVAGTLFRFWTHSHLWFDEALSVNISRLPLDRIPDALRHDGHPPLYYFLLHIWIEVFGIGDLAVRSLSGVISLATLPLAWYSGRRIGGPRVAWLTVVVLVLSPFAFRYATEARMYSLVMFLVFAGFLALVRAQERPSLGRLTLVAIVTALLTLTQYWDLYLIAVVGAGLAWRCWRAPTQPERRSARLVLASIAVGGLGFVPWLSVFREQLAHTGTPWGDPLFPWVAIRRSLEAFGGAPERGESYVLSALLVVAAMLAIFGRGVDERRIELDLRTRPAVRWEAAAALGAFLLGSAASYVSNTAFEPRYAATMFPLFVLVAAYGVTVFADHRVQAGMIAAVVALGVTGGVHNVVTQRTQAGAIAAVIAAEAHPGDLVVYCPDQDAPAVSRLLRNVPGLVQITFPDAAPPDRVNWTDYRARNLGENRKAFAERAVRRAGDHDLWFVTGNGQGRLPRICPGVEAALDRARPVHFERVQPNPPDFFEFDGLHEYRAR